MTKTFELDDQLRPYLTKILEERYSPPQTLEEYEALPDDNFKLHLWIKAEILRDDTDKAYKRNQILKARRIGRQIQAHTAKVENLQKELQEIVNFDHVMASTLSGEFHLFHSEYEALKNHKDIAPALAIKITKRRF